MGVKLISAVLAAMSIAGCFANTDNNIVGMASETVLTGVNGMTTDEKTEKQEFDRITYNEHGSVAEVSEYEILKTADGVLVTHYLGRWDYDKNGRENCVEKQLEGGKELYDQIAELAGKYNIRSWDGFSGINPNVLDGRSFSMEAELSDGSSIYARGSNSFPQNYSDFTNEIRKLLYN